MAKSPISIEDWHKISAAKSGSRRYVLLHEGKPKVVLVDFEEYVSLRVAVALLKRPEVVANILEGQSEIEQGESIELDDVMGQVSELVSDAARVSGEPAETVIQREQLSNLRDIILNGRAVPIPDPAIVNVDMIVEWSQDPSQAASLASDARGRGRDSWAESLGVLVKGGQQ